MTSPPEDIFVDCPKCHALYKDWFRASINFGLGDDFDEEYLEECSTSVCPECGYKVSHDLLVVEPDGVFRFEGPEEEESKFIELIEPDKPMSFAVKGDDGNFYNTLNELAAANKAFKEKDGDLDTNNDSKSDGTEWVHARVEKDHVEIIVACLSWEGPHTEIQSFEVAEVLEGNPSEQEIKAAKKRALSNKKYFQVCSFCKGLMRTGYMHDEDEGDGGICMSCASNNFGIKY